MWGDQEYFGDVNPPCKPLKKPYVCETLKGLLKEWNDVGVYTYVGCTRGCDGIYDLSISGRKRKEYSDLSRHQVIRKLKTLKKEMYLEKV